jgi:hypothetical protein
MPATFSRAPGRRPDGPAAHGNVHRSQTRSVTVSALGFARRRAEHRDGVGCALVFDGTPGGSHGVRTAGAEPESEPVSRTVDDSMVTEPGQRVRLEAVLDHAFADPNPRRQRRTLAAVVVYKDASSGSDTPPGLDRRCRWLAGP